MKRIFVLLLFLTYSNIILSQEVITQYPFYKDNTQMTWVDSIMNSMTIEEKIGQLFAVDIFSHDNGASFKRVENLVEKHGIGTVIFFKGSPSFQVDFTNRLQAVSKIPLMVAMDAEWGVSMRLDSTLRFPMQMSIAATNNYENSYLVSRQIAEECNRMGVQMNYAPVADVNINPLNPIIGRRSFGENIYKVSDMAIESVQAYTDNGVLSCAKHFPGHGDTHQDSHLTLPSVNADLARLDSIEFHPFRQLIEHGVPSIMVAHLKIPALEPNKKLPSSLSHIIIDSLLKNDMGFNGLVMSDALNMKGAQEFGSNVEINIQAFKAGNDILVYSQEIEKTIVEFKKQIDEGKISLDRLNYSVRKILMAKYWSGLSHFEEIDSENLISDLNSHRSKSVIEKVSRESITLIKNNDHTLPIFDLDKRIAHVNLGEDNFKGFVYYTNRYGNVDNFNTKDYSDKELQKKLKGYKTIIISYDNPFYSKRGDRNSYKRSYDNLLKTLSKITKSKKVILNLIGDPYHLLKLGDLNKFDAIVMSYKSSEYTQKYAASVIFGADKPLGVLPVSLGEEFPEGTSLTYPEIGRLSYSSPEEQGFDPNVLAEIDSLVEKSIADTVFPGAQILIARNGKIIYEKAFGFKTYKKKTPIDLEMLYDIASVTKVVSGTPILMKLVDQHKIKLDDNLGQYLSIPDSIAKKDITFREMMAHYAKLHPWIAFYEHTLKNGKVDYNKYYRRKKSSKYPIKVADNIYLRKDYRDSIIKTIIESPLRDTLEYKYSDLGYYLLQEIVENEEGKSLDYLASNWFYKPLHLKSLTYNPLDKFKKSSIVPSTDDDYFRNEVIYGTVHDPGAAMFGGVAAHAGVFSNAYDLAVFMQMYLQKGYYGGKRLFSTDVLAEFTKCQYCDKGNRRGIGFDKPQLEDVGPTCGCVSMKSFGHLGFTGTMVWADPEEKIVYIFLSNRTYPDEENYKLSDLNIRTEIQGIIYKALNLPDKRN